MLRRMPQVTVPTPDRRRFLAGGAALVGAVLIGCSGDDDADETDDTDDAAGSDDAGGSGDAGTDAGAGGDPMGASDAAAALTADDFAALGTCLLIPAQTKGPFYLDADLDRRDITEGRPGHPLRLGVRVVDADCAPIAGAVVEVWHADVDGDYSGFVDGSDSADDAGEGTTFLRGSQVADAAGIVEFGTIYPGWYTGRAVHVHVKAHIDGRTVLTSQLYFPEDLTDTVHAEPPYSGHGPRDTRNDTDMIAGDPAAAGNLLHTRAAGDGTLGLVVLGVDPAA